MTHQEQIEQELDRLITEIERSPFGKGILHAIHSCPFENTPTIRRRLYSNLVMISVERNPHQMLEISLADLTALLCEVYRWRQLYGEPKATGVQ